ncbi:MAG TPA: sialidase family protein [Candidatus Thermoplasmatota archaeon]|nr:sialidase family protein [Candidatus Thermoplasmatota archaeon]
MLARSPFLALALALLLAGCLTSSQPPPGPSGPGGAAQASWASICAISNWADSCTARASPNDSPSKTEIDLAVNPSNPLNVVVGSKDLDPQASNCVWAVPQVTLDGGRTWSSVIIGGPRDARMADPMNPLFGWECITDPIMVFDDGGWFYYALQAYNLESGGATCQTDGALPPLPAPVPVPIGAGCGSSFYLARSKDGGLTYDNIILMALADGGVVFHDYPRMIVNPATGTVTTVWNAVGSGGINPYVVSTRDRGDTVDAAPVVVQKPDSPRATAFASGFAATSDGTVYMTVWAFSPAELIGVTGGAGGDTAPLYLAVSTDDSQSFGGFQKILDINPITCPLENSEFRCGTFVELAADTSGGAHDGRLYAVWEDARWDGHDIAASWSDDSGATWTEPVKVNQDTTANAQWMSRPTVGADGTLHVLYMDRSFDPADKLYDAVHAWSADGLNWTSQRLTTVSSDGDLGVHQNGFPFIGDYVGIGIVGDHLYAGFPQTVTGKAEIAVAHIVKR